MFRPSVCIVSPALADANNGNWQTASRWARMLASHYRVMLRDHWKDEPADILVALHARRSAESIERWSRNRPDAALAVVLTGTDLYRDIATDPAAQRSLELADRLVVLHERAVDDLPLRYRGKAVACFQSTHVRATLTKTQLHLRAVMVGHLRDEKSPSTYFEAVRGLTHRRDIVLDHIGQALDPALGDKARELEREAPNYRWLAAQSHSTTRSRIQRAHVLVHPSRIEGGAHVIMEAIRSGTPVLATRIAGNVGMLGPQYAGYFELGDAKGLANLLERCRDDPASLEVLRKQCKMRSPLFEPARESATLRAVFDGMLEKQSR
jgi:putative glycosyltransferase (TIGR04348 family)